MTANGKTIFQNTVLLSTVELLARLMSLALIIAVARKLGPELMGVYAFCMAFILIFEIFGIFGLGPYIQREVSRHPEISGLLMARIFKLKLIIFLISALIILIFSLTAINDELKRQVIWVLTVTMFFKINLEATNSFFRAHQKATYEATVRMSFRLVYTSVGLIAILSGRGLLTLVILELIAYITACCTAWGIYIKKIDSPFHRVCYPDIGRLVRTTWNFLAIQFVQTIFNSIDRVMLSMMAGDIATGLYSVSGRFTGAFGFIPSAFSGSFFPALSRNITEDFTGFVSLFKTYFRFLLLIGAGLGAVIAGLSSQFIDLVFGKAFYQASPTLFLMAIALVFRFASWPFSSIILAMNKERQSLLIFFFSASVNIILNLISIPLWQEKGAALATIASLIMLIVLQLRAIGYDTLRQFQLTRLLFGPLITGCLTYSVIQICISFNMKLSLILTGSFFSYILFSFISGALKTSDLAVAKEFIIKK